MLARADIQTDIGRKNERNRDVEKEGRGGLKCRKVEFDKCSS